MCCVVRTFLVAVLLHVTALCAAPAWDVVCCCTTHVAVDDRTNDECNIGDEWPGGRTLAVMARLVAAVSTPLLDSKLLVVVHLSFESSICVVLFVVVLTPHG